MLPSCGNDDSNLPDPITVVLQRIMDDHAVDIIQECQQGSFCSQTLYFVGEYEFIGEQMLRLEENFYDLTELDRFEVIRVDDIKRIRLYFRN